MSHPLTGIDTKASQNVPSTWRMQMSHPLAGIRDPGFSKCPIYMEGSKCPTLQLAIIPRLLKKSHLLGGQQMSHPLSDILPRLLKMSHLFGGQQMTHPLAGIVTKLFKMSHLLGGQQMFHPQAGINTQASQNVPSTCANVQLALIAFPSFSKCPIYLEGSKCATFYLAFRLLKMSHLLGGQQIPSSGLMLARKASHVL